MRNGQMRRVEVWPDQTNGSPAADVKYRFVWTFPLTISPHDHKKLYVGSQFVHQTTDDGQSWQVISPDLTTNDKSKQGFSGGLTGDNIGVEYFSVIFAIAESPKEKGLIWVGTNDGLVQLTRDGGKNWTNVTKNIPDLPPWGTVSNIEPSRYEPGAAYLTVDFHQVNNRDPFIYKTKDYGKTWQAITNGIPHSMLSYAHCIREDPVRRGLLYVGTENGLYVSFNDGEQWEPLQSNLPRAPVYWMVVQEHFNDLVVGTYGRGFWILDDLTPVQQMDQTVRDASAHLFPPRPTYRFRAGTVPVSMSEDPSAGQNPPYGAAITYYLKSAPSGDVRVKIEDGKGQTIRTLNGTKNVGLNRVTWNLESEQTTEVRMRTSPAYAPDIKVGPDGTRNAPGAGRLSILMPPGTYTVKLLVGGQEFSQPLIVKKDPNSDGTEADITTQHTMMLELRADLESGSQMVNQIEFIRSQLEKVTAAKSATDALDEKLTDIEDELIQRKLTGQGQDAVRWPPKLLAKISYLESGLASGDFGPTKQQREVQALLKQQLAAVRQRLDGVLSQDLPTFNKLLADSNIKTVIKLTP
jgi:hypothetical protein